MFNRLSTGVGGFGLGLLWFVLDRRGVEVADWLFYPAVLAAIIMIAYALFPAFVSVWNLPAIQRRVPWEADIAIRWKRPQFETPTTLRPAAQRGFIDFQRDGDLAVQRFNRCLVHMSKDMEDSNKKNERFTRRFQAERAKQNTSFDRIYELTSAWAREIHRYTDKMEAHHKEMDAAVCDMSENYTNLLKWMTDEAGLTKSRESIQALHEIAPGTRHSMTSLRQTVIRLRDMNTSQSVNEACGRLVDVVSQIIGTIRKVEAFTTEAVRIVDQKLSPPNRRARRSTSQ